jgi:hypothetical protein
MKAIRLTTFLCIIMMMNYVIFGIWMRINFLKCLGLIITALTLVGYYLIPADYYRLWMAFAGGGVMIITALYYMIKWNINARVE